MSKHILKGGYWNWYHFGEKITVLAKAKLIVCIGRSQLERLAKVAHHPPGKSPPFFDPPLSCGARARPGGPSPRAMAPARGQKKWGTSPSWVMSHHTSGSSQHTQKINYINIFTTLSTKLFSLVFLANFGGGGCKSSKPLVHFTGKQRGRESKQLIIPYPEF